MWCQYTQQSAVSLAPPLTLNSLQTCANLWQNHKYINNADKNLNKWINNKDARSYKFTLQSSSWWLVVRACTYWSTETVREPDVDRLTQGQLIQFFLVAVEPAKYFKIPRSECWVGVWFIGFYFDLFDRRADRASWSNTAVNTLLNLFSVHTLAESGARLSAWCKKNK